MACFPFLYCETGMRCWLVDRGVGGMLDAFEKHFGKKTVSPMIRGLWLATWAGIVTGLGVAFIVLWTVAQIFYQIYHAAQDAIPSVSGVQIVWEVLSSEEFSRLLMETSGGTLILLIFLLLLCQWIWLLWFARKVMARLRRIEEQDSRAANKTDKPSHSEDTAKEIEGFI